MRKTHIVVVVIIALAIAAIIGSLSDSSTYADFKTAFSNPGREYHVVGELDRTQQVNYDPQQNPNLTSFFMVDNLGVVKKVHLAQSKPQDFERSESIVLIGKAKEDYFYASEILLKCPSKYNEANQIDDNNLQSNTGP